MGKPEKVPQINYSFEVYNFAFCLHVHSFDILQTACTRTTFPSQRVQQVTSLYIVHFLPTCFVNITFIWRIVMRIDI